MKPKKPKKYHNILGKKQKSPKLFSPIPPFLFGPCLLSCSHSLHGCEASTIFYLPSSAFYDLSIIFHLLLAHKHLMSRRTKAHALSIKLPRAKTAFLDRDRNTKQLLRYGGGSGRHGKKQTEEASPWCVQAPGDSALAFWVGTYYWTWKT